jgi:hypothetical protein
MRRAGLGRPALQVLNGTRVMSDLRSDPLKRKAGPSASLGITSTSAGGVHGLVNHPRVGRGVAGRLTERGGCFPWMFVRGEERQRQDPGSHPEPLGHPPRFCATGKLRIREFRSTDQDAESGKAFPDHSPAVPTEPRTLFKELQFGN